MDRHPAGNRFWSVLRIRRSVRLMMLVVLAPTSPVALFAVAYSLMRLDVVSGAFGVFIDRDQARMQAYIDSMARDNHRSVLGTSQAVEQTKSLVRLSNRAFAKFQT